MRLPVFLVFLFAFPLLHLHAQIDSLKKAFPETAKKMHFRKYEKKITFNLDSSIVTIELLSCKNGKECVPEKHTGNCSYRKKTWIYTNHQLAEYHFEKGKWVNAMFRISRMKLIDYNQHGRRTLMITERDNGKRKIKRAVSYRNAGHQVF